MEIEPQFEDGADKKLFEDRARFFNDVIGVLCVAIAFGALGTDAPRFYAFLGLIFTLLVMFRSGSHYPEPNIEINDKTPIGPVVRHLWKYYSVVVVGWLFLGLVSAGIFTKDGLF